MVICLEQGADLHMVQLMPLPLTISYSSKSRLVLPFWYRLTRVVPDKGPLNGCSSSSSSIYHHSKFCGNQSNRNNNVIIMQCSDFSTLKMAAFCI